MKQGIMKQGIMLDLTTDFQSMTSFRRRSAAAAKRLKRTRRPLVLTVKGKPELVVQTAESYQRLLDIATRADAREGIRQGLEQAKRKEGRDIKEFFADFEARHGVSD